MCIFITAIIPSTADLEKIRALSSNPLLSFSAYENISLKKAFPDSRIGRITTRECDCETVLGYSNRDSNSANSSTSPDANEINRLRSKGWSEAKIQRALSEKSQSREQKQNSRAMMQEIELQAWTQFLQLYLKANVGRSFGLLLHMYQGNLEDEPIVIRERVSLSQFKLTDEKLLQLSEDIFYEFKP